MYALVSLLASQLSIPTVGCLKTLHSPHKIYLLRAHTFLRVFSCVLASFVGVAVRPVEPAHEEHEDDAVAGHEFLSLSVEEAHAQLPVEPLHFMEHVVGLGQAVLQVVLVVLVVYQQQVVLQVGQLQLDEVGQFDVRVRQSRRDLLAVASVHA